MNAWAQGLGVQYSSQVAYNTPTDMLSAIPSVSAPECESLDFAHNIDAYRQYVGTFVASPSGMTTQHPSVELNSLQDRRILQADASFRAKRAPTMDTHTSKPFHFSCGMSNEATPVASINFSITDCHSQV